MEEKQPFKTQQEVVTLQNFYKAVMPNITTTRNNLIWFNSSDTLEDNAYPSKLLDLYVNKSSVHSNFISLKSNLSYASGLFPKDENNNVLKEFLETENRAGNDLNEIYAKMCMDFSIFEAAALQVVYNQEGGIAEVYHTDVSKLRAEEPDEYGKICNWYYNSSWGLITNKRTVKVQNSMRNAVKIPAFNPETGVEDGRQILYMKRYTAGNDIYSIPSYASSINWIELDYELSLFHLGKVANGFFPSALVTMFGNPDEEEKDEFVSKFKAKHLGSSNTGKVVFQWVDSVTNKPVFDRIASDTNDDLFNQLNDITSQKIATGHGADLSLAGIEGKGSDLGGSANKINLARLHFTDTVIEGFQNTMLKGINRILKVNNLGEVTVHNEGLKIEQPLQQATDLTEDERRNILFGLPPKVDAASQPEPNPINNDPELN